MAKSDTTHFIKNLKALMERRNLNIKELANELAMPPSTVHGWLNGVPPKSILHIRSLAQFFNCPIEELFFGDITTSIHTDLVISIGDQKLKIILKKIS